MFSAETREGVVGRYTFHGARLVAVEYRPVRIDHFAQPRFLEGAEAEAVLGQMEAGESGRCGYPPPGARRAASALCRPAVPRAGLSAPAGLRPGRGRPQVSQLGEPLPRLAQEHPGAARRPATGAAPARKTAARNSARKVSIQLATAPRRPPGRPAEGPGDADQAGPQGDRLRRRPARCGCPPWRSWATPPAALRRPETAVGIPHSRKVSPRRAPPRPPLAPPAAPPRAAKVVAPHPAHVQRLHPAPASSRALRREGPAPVSLAITGSGQPPRQRREGLQRPHARRSPSG